MLTRAYARSVKIGVIFAVRFERQKVDKKSKPTWKLKHANSILKTFEYFCQISSKLIAIIQSHTISKLVHYFRHSVCTVACFPHSTLVWRPLGNPLEFLDKTYPTKTRGMGLPCVKISWSYLQPLLYESPVWRTDRRTGDSICCRALKMARFPTLLCFIPSSGGTRYYFWMKLTPQKLNGWRYRKVKIS